MARFNRDYKLTFTIESTEYVVAPPMHISFDCSQSIYSNLNKLNIQIYNMNETHRRAITKEQEDTKKLYSLSFFVGYENSLQKVFQGNINTATTTRNGVNFITKISSLDGLNDYKNANVASSTTTMQEAWQNMSDTFSETKKGEILVVPNTTRPIVMVGNTIEEMKQHLNDDETLFIDNGIINIINTKKNDKVGAFIPVVSAESGLITTPERKNKKVSFKTMMNPTIRVGGAISLKSETASYLNGLYRVETIASRGDYRGSEWEQAIEGYAL